MSKGLWITKTMFWSSVWPVIKVTMTAIPIGVTIADHIGGVAGVCGRSMQPTFNPDYLLSEQRIDRIFLNKWSTRHSKVDLQRGDVVVLAAPDEPDVNVVKRIIAVSGDTIDSLNYDKKKKKSIVVPPGHCWIEGDNANNSKDSNHYGVVPIALIRAKVTHIVWPPSRAGRVPDRPLPSDRVKICNTVTNSLKSHNSAMAPAALMSSKSLE